MSISVISSRYPGQVVLVSPGLKDIASGPDLIIYFQHLDRKNPTPTLPYELHDHVSADAWAMRIPQLVRLGSRYNYPVLELAWLVLMFIASFAVPAGLHYLILHSLEKKMSHSDAFYQTRFISFAIGIGVTLVFAVPLIVWKSVGQARATKLVKRWEAEDARLRSPGAFVPVWTVKISSSLTSFTRLTITTPYVHMQSYFHPAAYMPSWINGPIDPGASNGFHAAKEGSQKPAMYGEVPLYGNYNGGSGDALPQYNGDGARPYSDEKKVKV
ncbi:hypothetical protein B0F90DRAFT_370588 [Multifurca ochricompacta]|uniref:Uncharacterized protein n=1 Tax=Multifurca ochricompacta TaxID=376703 RepID=A0AAD4QM84_9AGAM|nr:hypothetical protein B0F90DRAFT_370588 [Multifurca ochricompacta]